MTSIPSVPAVMQTFTLPRGEDLQRADASPPSKFTGFVVGPFFCHHVISDDESTMMADAGIVAVEADDPASVVTVVPGAPLASSDDLAMAALSALATCGWADVSARFVKELHSRLAAREAKAVGNGLSGVRA